MNYKLLNILLALSVFCGSTKPAAGININPNNIIVTPPVAAHLNPGQPAQAHQQQYQPANPALRFIYNHNIALFDLYILFGIGIVMYFHVGQEEIDRKSIELQKQLEELQRVQSELANYIMSNCSKP